jgi:hypothetical protein
MGGCGAGGGIGWTGHGRGAVGAHIARHNATQNTLDALEADMTERGLEIPPRPMPQRAVFLWGFLCGLLLGLMIGLVFWELT